MQEEEFDDIILDEEDYEDSNLGIQSLREKSKANNSSNIQKKDNNDNNTNEINEIKNPQNNDIVDFIDNTSKKEENIIKSPPHSDPQSLQNNDISENAPKEK